MSTESHKPRELPPGIDVEEQGWPEMTPEEAAELRAAFDEAHENQRRGIGVPADDVLPRRLRRAG